MKKEIIKEVYIDKAWTKQNYFTVKARIVILSFFKGYKRFQTIQIFTRKKKLESFTRIIMNNQAFLK